MDKDTCLICGNPKGEHMSLICEMCDEQELYPQAVEKKAFNEGVMYALEYLSDLYDGIKSTSIWAEFSDEEQEAN